MAETATGLVSYHSRRTLGLPPLALHTAQPFLAAPTNRSSSINS